MMGYIFGEKIIYLKLFNEIIFRIVFNEENQEKWQNIADNYINQI